VRGVLPSAAPHEGLLAALAKLGSAAKAVVAVTLCLETGALRISLANLTAPLPDGPPSAVAAAVETRVADVVAAVDHSQALFVRAARLPLALVPASERAPASRPAPLSLSVAPGGLRVRVRSLHRLPAAWLSKFRSFSVSFAIHAGPSQLHPERASAPAATSKAQFPLPVVLWDRAVSVLADDSDTVNFTGGVELPVALAELPREARLVVYVHGHVGGSATERLAWVALPLVTHSGCLVEGDAVLGLWLKDRAPALGTWPSAITDSLAPLMIIGFPVGPAALYHDLEPTDILPPPPRSDSHRVRWIPQARGLISYR
jgi:hypothetical protein